jgi:hypothetical protein
LRQKRHSAQKEPGQLRSPRLMKKMVGSQELE